MDIPRQPRGRNRRWLALTGALLALVILPVAFGRLRPAAPEVDRDTIYTGQVERGEMIRRVRGPGRLVSEQVRWISALTAGRVERILVEPGAQVDSSTVVLVLSNPDVDIQALEAQRQLTAEEARLVDLETRLENERLSQEASVASVWAQSEQAQRIVKSNRELAERRLISDFELENSRDRAEELLLRLDVERKRLEVMNQAEVSQLDAQRAQVERLRSIAEFRQGLVESMRVVAGVPGVLTELPLESGQWVTPGETLARVVQPGRLKAELRIPEAHARDVAVGQAASIDTRNESIPGRVSRIDPAVQAGTVRVDVRLEGGLPKEARPELSIDGVIEIERLSDVLYVDRPAHGQPNSTADLFKVVVGGGEAVRVRVRLGRSSVKTIEIVDGLVVGDEVILSDMSAYRDADRVRLR